MFPVDIWGTVAAWVGSVGSVVSLATAALYYRSTVKRQERSQAYQVRFVSIDGTDSSVRAKVVNDSDRPIYDIEPRQTRLSFNEVIRHEQSRRMVEASEIPELLKEWNETPGGMLQAHAFDRAHIESGGELPVVFSTYHARTQKCWVRFRDANGKLWSLVLDTHQPMETKEDNRKQYSWWDIVNPKTKSARLYRNHVKKIERLAKEKRLEQKKKSH